VLQMLANFGIGTLALYRIFDKVEEPPRRKSTATM
jgi:hypothetical protein